MDWQTCKTFFYPDDSKAIFDFDDNKAIFLQDIPPHDDASPYQVLLQKIQPVHRILPGQTLNKILKLCCVWPWPQQANIFTNTLAYEDVPLKAMTVLNIFQTSLSYVRWQRWFT